MKAIQAFALAHLGPGLTIVAAFVLASATYCGGKSQGRADERGHGADSLKKVYAHRSDSLEAALRDSAKVAKRLAAERDSLLRIHVKATQTFHAHVTVIDSNTVRIDNGPPVHEIPVALALPPIVTCEPVIQIDSAGLKLKDAQIATIAADRDTWKSRALVAEARRGSRFGLKSGIALGATAVGFLVYLIK